MILILDASNHLVSVVGGEPPRYVDGRPQALQVFNHIFNHPHDVQQTRYRRRGTGTPAHSCPQRYMSCQMR
jgi:hypothetical protein